MPQAPPCSPDDCSPLPFEVRPLPPELLSNAFSGNTKATTLDASSVEVEKKGSTKKQGKRGREYSESDDEAETKKQRRRCH